jgi:peptidyl-tRNA hydrolase
MTFKNVAGLTLSPVYDSLAIKSYVTKDEGRVKGPFYGGKKEMFDKQMAKSNLRKWQKQLFEILTGEQQEMLKDRKVIWVQDSCGNTGKSWFQKWLRIGQKKMTVRSLPVSSVDRLISAVNIINKTHKVDAFTIDLTRTQGEDQSYKDLFSTIEQIKNGYVIDVMYGKYNEAIFKPPMVLIFTNNKHEEFAHYLSYDRWEVYTISPDGDLAETYSPYEHVRVEDKTKNIILGNGKTQD